MSEFTSMEEVVLHAISRQHKWDFACIDCRPLTTLHVRLQQAKPDRDAADAKVAAADAAHSAEPYPREPHEGDYWRGQRDAMGWFMDVDP